MKKYITKVFAVVLSLFLLVSLVGCKSLSEEKEVEILSVRYLLITYEEDYDEILDVSFYYNGYQQYDIDPDLDLTIGNENKVILQCNTNNSGFWVKEVMLTTETYNEMINASPNVYEIE